MRKILLVALVIMPAFIPYQAYAYSTKCSSLAASVYYGKLVNDQVITMLRGAKGEISIVEINTLNDLIYSCEKGIENKSYDSKGLWNFNYNNAKKINIAEETARAYASAHVEMYEYGKSIK